MSFVPLQSYVYLESFKVMG